MKWPNYNDSEVGGYSHVMTPNLRVIAARAEDEVVDASR
jgi:hypothetical protein